MPHTPYIILTPKGGPVADKITTVKTGKDLDNIREACRLLAEAKKYIKGEIKAGISTYVIDRLFQKKVKDMGAQCAFLGYDGFPGALCLSVNDQFLHCPPSEHTILRKGDLLKIDSGVRFKGMNSDSAFTVVVDEPKPAGDIKRLIDGTKEAMYAGIDAVKDGCRTGDITHAVETVLRKHKLGAVYQLGGHGIGESVHEGPFIHMSRAVKGTGPTLKAGMTICIEPMATLGGDDVIFDDKDGWSIWTADGSLGAHFEETILVTKDGAEILT